MTVDTTRQSREQAGPPPVQDPDRALIIVSDDGKIYKLDQDEWQQAKYELKDDPGAAGIVNQLTTFGSYVAFVQKNLALKIGACCTVVNLRSILKGAGVIN
jgi:hypothetical protein